MKKKAMTYNLRCLLGIALALIIVGGKTSYAVKPPSDKGDHVVTGGDLALMDAAATGGMAEIELGRLAEKRAEKSEVKAFGEKMVADHSKAGKQLEALAEQKHVELPAKLKRAQKETLAKLSKLSGSAFDRAYVATMVMVHKKDVVAFKAEAKSGTDADVKAFAAATLPTLEEHLRIINALAAKMG